MDTKSFQKVVAESSVERARVRELVATKQWQKAETNKTRLANYLARRAATQLPHGPEAMQGATLDLQAAWFLPEGAQTRRAVGYVEATSDSKSVVGTGFMVSGTLFITNQHVIEDAGAALGAQITFDRELDEAGRPAPTTTYLLDPERFALFSDENDLDYALIAVGERRSGTAELADLSFCVLSNRPDKHAIGMNVNIIQHPLGEPKMIAVRNNILTYRTPRTLLYETDTDNGSSGSPVFNDDWELVALHHWGQPFLETVDDQGHQIPNNVNEGIRISSIYEDLSSRLDALPPDQRNLLAAALKPGAETPATDGQRLSPPHRPDKSAPAVQESGTAPDQIPALSPPHRARGQSEAMIMSNDSPPQPDNATGAMVRITVPLEITVRFGASGMLAPGAEPAPVVRLPASSATAPGAADSFPTAPALSQPRPATVAIVGAEKLVIDQDYSNRDGYSPSFIAGMQIPLPEADEATKADIVPLNTGGNAAGGELTYEHFSIKMRRSKRVALFTATNISGDDYLNVDRVTGKVQPSAEGEVWFKDPRIDPSAYLDQTFYSAWSTYFDRGHLTRRMDPAWGTPEQAERANADTYHFTNCSPQHFRFNEATQYWQGAEQYVLENGAIAKETKNRISVFQGPIYDDTKDLWAGDDVQIPSSFFKIIAWKGKKGPRAVALVVDQLALLGEPRKSLGAPKTVPSNVEQWRVSVASIETRTGLKFGKAINDADTIKQKDQPTVGEALVAVRSMQDLLPAWVSA